jgi:tRNA-dihydrouridine synthase 2
VNVLTTHSSFKEQVVLVVIDSYLELQLHLFFGKVHSEANQSNSMTSAAEERDDAVVEGGEDSSAAMIDHLKDSSSPHSLQNPPSQPAHPNNDDSFFANNNADNLTPQEVANHLFCNSEILAPMVRASTTPLRTLALHHGATLVYTEELIDRSITSPTVRIINTELGTIDYRVPKHTYSAKVQRRLANDTDNPDAANGAVILRIDPKIERHKLIYQMGTGEPNLALEAAQTVIQDVYGLDVNMGCPKKFSVSGGMGSALLGDTNRACDIISTLRRTLNNSNSSINSNKPVSAKIRLLHETNPSPTVDFVRALVASGVNAITIHGRIRGDESTIMARWETLISVVRELKMHVDTRNIPIIINGDLYTREDIHEMKLRTGCDGIMLARPALYNISLFRRGSDEDEEVVEQQQQQQQQGDGGNDNNVLQQPITEFQQTNHSGYYGYNSPLLQSRTSIVQEYIAHCVRYKAHSKNAKYVICEMMNSRRAPNTRVPFLNMEFEGGQNIQSICKCRSLDDLVKVWDVKWTIPMPSSSNAAACSGEATTTSAEASDLHNYDDRYFLDHDKFRKERNDALDEQLKKKNSGSYNGSEEKKEADGSDDIPMSKRPKI